MNPKLFDLKAEHDQTTRSDENCGHAGLNSHLRLWNGIFVPDGSRKKPTGVIR